MRWCWHTAGWASRRPSSWATGSLIAFNDEIEAWISPQLFRVAQPMDGRPVLDPFELRERVLASRPGAASEWVDLAPQPGHSVFVGLDAEAGRPPPANDQVFVDPYTGRILGERRQADLTQGLKNLMPFVYELHTSLALGDAGPVVLGIAALVWTLDCFIGFYLTLPLRRGRRMSSRLNHRSWGDWWQRWFPAWKVRAGASSTKLVFDLHRAGGLWSWAMLFVLAWSGVGLNLAAVYQPVMWRVSGYAISDDAALRGSVPAGHDIGWRAARDIARTAMQVCAQQEGFTVLRERLIHRDASRGIYEYRVLSTRDVGAKLGNTTLFLDAGTGRVVRVDLPTGRHVGNTLDTWMSSLHTAAWGGWPMQVLLCVTGVVVVVLSVTGVLIWRRKRLAKTREPARCNLYWGR